jgi:hypothetical protein
MNSNFVLILRSSHLYSFSFLITLISILYYFTEINLIHSILNEMESFSSCECNIYMHAIEFYAMNTCCHLIDLDKVKLINREIFFPNKHCVPYFPGISRINLLERNIINIIIVPVKMWGVHRGRLIRIFTTYY